MKAPPPIGPCKLCGTTGILHRSHIIPKWAYRRLISFNPPDHPASPIRVEKESAILSPIQETEYMLGSSCEALFGGWEKYVASIALQKDNSVPAMEHIQTLSLPSDSELRSGDASRMDTDQITKFAVSVFWRASVSISFSEVTFGEKYNKIFADFLLGKTSFPAEACLIIEFMTPPREIPRIDRLVTFPESQHDREAFFHIHQFCLLGMRYYLLVGGQVPDEMRKVSFVDNRIVLLSDGKRFLRSVAPAVKRATPKGRLISAREKKR